MANWRKYIFENDADAAARIMLAANYGGRAINISQTTAAHAMSYKITSLYKLPHGHAVAVCLPKIWKYMIGHFMLCIDKRGHDYLKDIFNDISNSMGCSTPVEAIEVFEQLMMEMELFNPMAINREEELSMLSTSVNPVRLNNNPIQLSHIIIYQLYGLIIR